MALECIRKLSGSFKNATINEVFGSRSQQELKYLAKNATWNEMFDSRKQREMKCFAHEGRRTRSVRLKNAT